MTRRAAPAPAPVPAVPPAAPARHELHIPNFRPATLNELTKTGNRYSAARLKRRDRDVIAAYAHMLGTPRAAGKRRVSIRVTLGPGKRQTDPDSLHKSTLDALKHAGLIVDDSPRWLELGPVEQARGPELATTIILEDL